MRRLIYANAALLAAVVLHGFDHLRQERGVGALNTEVIVGGQVIFVLVLTSFVLAVRRHPRTAAVSAFTGLWVAVGVTISHFVPEWSALSDPYVGNGFGAFSWFAALAEASAGAALGAIGLAELARRRTAAT